MYIDKNCNKIQKFSVKSMLHIRKTASLHFLIIKLHWREL